LRTFRRHLTLLVLAVFLPATIFGITTAWYLADQAAGQITAEGSRMASGSAADLAGYFDEVTHGLAITTRAKSLETGDLQLFYNLAQAIRESYGGDVLLTDGEGNLLLHTARPFGTPLPQRTAPELSRQAIESGHRIISDSHLDAVTGQPEVSIDVPVIVGGSPRYVLDNVIPPTALTSVINQTRWPEGWMTEVIDANGDFLLRSSIHQTLGRQAEYPDFRKAIDGRDSGSFPATIQKDLHATVFFDHISGTNWTILVEVPQKALWQPMINNALFALSFAAVALILTILGAQYFLRRLNQATALLAQAASDLGQGKIPEPVDMLEEFDHVSHVMANAAREIIAGRRQAESALASKQRFFAAASHDLRQPVQAISMFVTLLEGQPVNQQQATILRHLRTATTHLSDMLQALLDISKLDTGITRPNLTSFPLAELIEEVIGETRPQAAAKGLNLRFYCVAAHQVVSDRMMVGRILRNLVTNAIRYTKGGGVLVACRRRGAALRLEVWDTGMGMAADRLQFIWEEFYQIEHPGRGHQQGLGIGLAIVKRLANALNLQLSVRSRPGKGSMFAVTFPAQPPLHGGWNSAPNSCAP
jgi:signal transduction histidine kinase